MVKLEEVLAREFPELEVDVPAIHGNSDIDQEELSQAIRYIKKNKLVEDSRNLVPGGSCSNTNGPMRDSVSYPIIFPNQKRPLYFDVMWVQGPDVYIGCIASKDSLGEHVIEARMYGMWLKSHSLKQ